MAESELRFYKTKMEKYGLPLDSRKSYTKSDWEIWTASLADNRVDLESFIKPIAAFAHETAYRVPLTDRYDTGNA